MADDRAIIGFARGQIALRHRQLRPAELKPRFGLRDVGPGDVADFKAVAGRLEVGGEDPDVVLVQLDDCTVADDVHVDRHGEGEDVAFDRTERRAPRIDPALGGVDRVADAAAVEQRHAQIDGRRDVRSPARARIQNAAARQVAIEADLAADLRPSAGLGDCDAGVSRLERLALGGQRRVAVIGRHQCVAKRVRRCSPGQKPGDQRSGDECTKHCEPLRK